MGCSGSFLSNWQIVIHMYKMAQGSSDIYVNIWPIQWSKAFNNCKCTNRLWKNTFYLWYDMQIIYIYFNEGQQMLLSRKKTNYVIRFFELHWRSRFSHFSLGTFEKVGGHPGPNGTSDETHSQQIFFWIWLQTL